MTFHGFLCLVTWICSNSSDMIYQLNDFRKSPPPQNRQLMVDFHNSEQFIEDFMGELTFYNHFINTLCEIRMSAPSPSSTWSSNRHHILRQTTRYPLPTDALSDQPTPYPANRRPILPTDALSCQPTPYPANQPGCAHTHQEVAALRPSPAPRSRRLSSEPDFFRPVVKHRRRWSNIADARLAG